MHFSPYKHKILSYEQAAQTAAELKKQGKKIVMVSGCYDIIHAAHAAFLYKCQKLGDTLFLSLGSDETITTLKGPHRPIIREDLRAELLAALSCVDFVVIASEGLSNTESKIDYSQLLKIIKPHILAINDYDSAIEQKQQYAAQFDTHIALIDCSDHPPITTTNIEHKIKTS